MFAPGSHAGTGLGLPALREAAQVTDLPVIAIGGIGVEQVEACIEAGARGVAVVSGVLGAPDVGAAVEAYLAAINGSLEGMRV